MTFFVGCMVSRPNRLLQDLTTMSLINKISQSIVKRFKNHYFSAGQVGYLVQDLLEIAKEQYEVLEFVTAVSHVKAFEVRFPKVQKY